MLLLCVWLKLFRCRFVPLLDATVPRSYVQLLYRPDYSQCPNSPTLKFHSPVSPDPLNARSLRSLGFPKSPPSKNPRSATETNNWVDLLQFSSVQFSSVRVLWACTAAATSSSCACRRSRRRCLQRYCRRRPLSSTSASCDISTPGDASADSSADVAAAP